MRRIMMAVMLLGSGFVITNCSFKSNYHIGPDGQGGYYRTYSSTEKLKVNAQTQGTGIEHCKAQGSDIVCKDFKITHAQ